MCLNINMDYELLKELWLKLYKSQCEEDSNLKVSLLIDRYLYIKIED